MILYVLKRIPVYFDFQVVLNPSSAMVTTLMYVCLICNIFLRGQNAKKIEYEMIRKI